MPTNTLLEYKEGYGRDFLIKEEVLGPIIAELQDHVEDLDVSGALAALLEGHIFVGDNNDEMASLDASGDKKILIGNGTTISSRTVSGDVTIGNTGVVTIADDAVTNAKAANITRGSVKVGGTADAPTDLNAKTSGQILVGDGTDILSVPVSGDATLAASGAVTIAALAVTGAKASVVMATKSIYVPLATIATTGAQEFTIPVPHASTLIGAKLCAKDALATDNSNYLTFALTNKGAAGAGTTAMLSATASGTTQTTGGAAIAAYTTRNLPLHATGGNAVVAANDCLALSVTATGTLANTVTEGRIRLDFQVTT